MANDGAFAAVSSHGKAIVWGSSNHGGVLSEDTFQRLQSGVKQIRAYRKSFVAVFGSRAVRIPTEQTPSLHVYHESRADQPYKFEFVSSEIQNIGFQYPYDNSKVIDVVPKFNPGISKYEIVVHGSANVSLQIDATGEHQIQIDGKSLAPVASFYGLSSGHSNMNITLDSTGVYMEKNVVITVPGTNRQYTIKVVRSSLSYVGYSFCGTNAQLGCTSASLVPNAATTDSYLSPFLRRHQEFNAKNDLPSFMIEAPSNASYVDFFVTSNGNSGNLFVINSTNEKVLYNGTTGVTTSRSVALDVGTQSITLEYQSSETIAFPKRMMLTIRKKISLV